MRRECVYLRGFYDSKKMASMRVYIEKAYFRKVGMNLWYCKFILKPDSSISPKVMLMRMSKRMVMLFKRGYRIVIDIISYYVDRSRIVFDGLVNRSESVWRPRIFHRSDKRCDEVFEFIKEAKSVCVGDVDDIEGVDDFDISAIFSVCGDIDGEDQLGGNNSEKEV